LYRSNQEIEIFVVDNASGDDTIEYLSARYPDVYYIANSENVGFGRANNQALKLAKGKYVLFLNPDTIVAERTIEGCVNLMESNAGVGAIGVRMQYSDGHFAPESRRSVPTPFVSFCKMSGLGRLFPNSKLFARYHLSYIDKDLA
jgi:GT2 family glycosyltransferase